MRVREHRAWGPAGGGADPDFWTALVLCNDANAKVDADAETAPQHWRGDPTETALLQAAQDTGLDVAAPP